MSNETHANSMPVAVCPHCGKEFHWDDYYELKGDNEEHECPHCEQTIYCTDVEAVMYATLSTERSR
jgi:uncharacterized Zn-finger protein